MDELKRNLSAAHMLVLGFMLLIFTGAVLLCLPISSASRSFTPFLDCLFTAASAGCVTGLVVVNTAAHWSLFGKAVILCLIQVGGLGFVTVMMAALIMAGKRITLKDRMIIQETFSLEQHSGMVRFVKFLIRFTLTVELTGAAILTARFTPEFGFVKALGMSIFHSVSAFCNAGFDVIGTSSLIPYADDIVVNIVIMALVVTGGLGFPVWLELIKLLKTYRTDNLSLKQELKRLSLHTKLVLNATVILIAAGAVITLVLEHNNPLTMGNYSLQGKLLSSLFHSVVLRTAGFVSIDYGGLRNATKMLSIVLMMIGGSPCGTAGGIKTISTSVIVVAVMSFIRDRDSICACGRSISIKALKRALTITMLMLTLLILSATLLSVTEPQLTGRFEFIDLMFEAASALATVGSTIGLTSSLSSVGKIIIIACMFVGRLGTVTIAISFLTSDKSKNRLHYPMEDIMAG